MTTVYFVRHAAPNYHNHDDLTRELTEQGLQDRRRVTEFLWDKDIDTALSSPYKRSVDTIKEFADARGLEITLIDDFRERKVGGGWIEDFDEFCRKQWEDFGFKLPEGESLREVQRRNIRALLQVLKIYCGKNVIIGSHGTALSTVIHYFDPSFGYDGFCKIKNLMPWIVKFSFEDDRCMGIQTYRL
ncbi:MAG: histidine phosphatase family protein [Lachnospiraceae bacterium]|uniref:histidine phosphatase family protein n=1 Tax=Parablautia intestinalis TaxID=2320100 RepID=UPI00256EA1AC|nr:histidine phosphatase family protein [Parablautia intestinalis]MCI8615882.1 histidine phosphatase family protein [Lachnospiraceae bacterium]